ncbi:DNRLRE domain-containing protein [Streptomyces sp. TRM49041]|uniref:DNRLRE domain-containing protein n=1 Tax=Streptomyces sp. TRM49041 TaxID=2603216 RepID=UPI00165684A9|nr:DNRLRE domain-containing protein [Streptomyces sp. TRM49041]
MKRSRKRRRYAALAALLAVAVAVPVGLQLDRGPAKEQDPRAEAKGAPKGPVTAPEAMREARRTGKDVVVTARHTASSTTWAQPDGRLRTRTYGDTIRARVGGEWKPIDTTLQRVDDGYAPKAVNDPLLFSAGTAGENGGRASRAVARTSLTSSGASDDSGTWTDLVRLRTDGHEMVVRWPGRLPAPVVVGPRALYEDVRPGIDLLLTARDSGYSHVLIVKNRAAADDPLLDRLRYRLASPTLKFDLDPASKAVSARDSAGREVAAAPTPYMWDSAGDVRVTIGEPTPSLDPAARDTSLALPGLAGPQPGSRDAVLGAGLGDGGLLDVTVDRRMLTDSATVYPLFIDPSFKVHKANWTLLYKKYASSSFYNGQNFNDGTNEARVGYESDSGGLSRSVFSFDYDEVLHGSTIHKAYFRGLQTYSWGCASRQYNIYLTSTISPTTTWNSQPSWIRFLDDQVNGHGYNTTNCPDQWIGMDVTSAAQEASRKEWGVLTLGLRAANESDTAAWKKFLANGENAPYIEIYHNDPPNEPTAAAMKMSPGGTCDTVSPFPAFGKSDLTFTVTGSDPDGNLKYVNLHVWPTGSPGTPVTNQNLTPSSGGTAGATIPWTTFTNGTTYSWQARTIDTDGLASAWGPAGTTAPCQFTVDHSAPQVPGVSSAAFPAADDDGSVWSTVEFGTAGLFTFSTGGSDDVKEYQYSFNTAFNLKASPNPLREGRAIVSLSPPHAGPSVLYVRAMDKTGNVGKARVYFFYVRPAPVMDTPMDVTGDNVPDVYTITPEGNLELYPKTAGTDRLHRGMPAAYTTAGGAAKLVPDGYWTGASISHNGDWLPGDGIQDLVARMSDGRLYVYPGDGYSGFDVSKRVEILLPTGSPAPSTIRQVLSVGDVTGDSRPDLLAIAGQDLWAFTGYTGASFAKATFLSGEAWAERDLVQVGDIAADGAPDLVFRENATGQLQLRYGRNAASGGLDFGSYATKAASAGQLDTYGASGWRRSAIPVLAGTPDVNGDGLPEVWALFAGGDVAVYPGRVGGLSAADVFYVVMSNVSTSWSGHTAIG